MRHFVVSAVLLLTATATHAATWETISNNLFSSIPGFTNSGTWYRDGVGTIFVNPVNGDLLAFPNRYDTYVSKDQGETWSVVEPSGTGRFAVQGIDMNNTTGDFIVWRIEGPSACIYENMSAHNRITQVGDGFMCGAADWSQNPPQDLLGKQHHSTKIHLSGDGGKTWNQIIGDSERATMLSANRICYYRDSSIILTADQGATGRVVAHFRPKVEWPMRYDDNVFWMAKEGLFVSRDSLETWQKIEGPWGTKTWVLYGPYFGASVDVFIMAAAKGVYKTLDGGKTWERIADYVDPDDAGRTHWGWDHINNVLYVAGHCQNLYRLRLGPVAAEPTAHAPARLSNTGRSTQAAYFNIRGQLVGAEPSRPAAPGAYVGMRAEGNGGFTAVRALVR